MTSRSARAWRTVAIVLVVLIVLFIGADRLGDYIAEREAAKTIQNSQNLPSRPDVDIAGFPFLTQLAEAKFGHVTITADDVPVGGAGRLLDLARVHVVLHTVRVARDFGSVRADTASATATATYAELSRTLGLTVSYAGNGRIKATKQVQVAGSTLTATLTTSPTLSGGALAFTNTTIANLGQLGQAVGSALNHVFDLAIPLQSIPFDIQVTGLRVDDDGVELVLTGQNLQYGS